MLEIVKTTVYILFLFSVFACKKPMSVQTSNSEDLNIQNKIPYQSYLMGDSSDVKTSTSAGIVLMGGGRDVDEAMRWMIQKSGGGDFVVIRASGADGYNSYIYKELGGVNSCETILISSKAIAQSKEVATKIRNAEALFIAGGDQANYVNYWKDTPVEDAINYLIRTKKVPVGGTSAGCAILGKVYFSAIYGTVSSEEALSNPYHRAIALGKDDFIEAECLQNTITDQHFSQRNRQGRLLGFMARMVKDWGLEAKGIGVDEQTAVLIDDNSLAKVVGSHKAFFIQRNAQSMPEICTANTPLTWDNKQKAVKAYEIQAVNRADDAGSFDLKTWENGTKGIWKYASVKQGSMMYE